MTRNALGVLAAAAVVLAAASAGAGTLTSASLTLSVDVYGPVGFAASGLAGGQASGSGATAAWSVAAGAVPGGTATTTVPTSATGPVTQIQFVVNGNPATGLFAAGGGGMALDVVLNWKGLGGLTLLPVDLPVGTPTATSGSQYGFMFTFAGNAWTTGTTALTLTTPTGGGATQATAQGANGLVAGAGTVVLVTAVNLVTDQTGQWPTFAVLTLNYAPEPAGLLLAGSAAVALALAQRRRRTPAARDVSPEAPGEPGRATRPTGMPRRAV